MKKILISIFTILLVLPFIGIYNGKTFDAEEYYSFGCDYSKYSVDYINDDGSFTNKGCYSNFSDAKSNMRSLGDDYVVRHATSLSPTKIVAMNSGLVYSYPGRSGTNTMNIYQDASTRNMYYKQTYVSNHYEMAYVDTERYLPNYNGGIVQVVMNGFEGYADLEYTDLVPSKYLDNGIAIYLGGNNTYDGETPFKVKPKRNYFEAVNNGKYTDLVFHYSRAYSSSGGNPDQYSIYIGKAPSFMNIGTKYYSCDGVNFYKKKNFTDLAGTYYNYYQFLPLRSKTNISANTLENFLSNAKSGSVMSNHCVDFINEQNTYGINGLLLFAMACQESAYGTSGYAKNRNNLFGWNAFDSNPSSASTFNSVSDCINEQAGINLRGFVDITDGRFFSSSLGNKGSGLNVKYASDPYWGMKIAAIAYSVDKYANNKNGNYTDLNKYPMALINTFDIDVKQSPSSSSKTLYTTQYGPYYQKDFIVIPLETTGSYTKIQSTNAIDSNGNIKTHKTPITTGTTNPISTYDFDKSVAYVKSSYLTQIQGEVNSAQVQDEPIENCTFNRGIRDLYIDNNKLNIDGFAFIKGFDFTDISVISHKVNLVDIESNSVIKTYDCETYKYNGIKFNDGHTYDYVGYKCSIPFEDLNAGSYYLEVEVSKNANSLKGIINTINDDYNNLNTSYNDVSLHFSTNEVYDYRVEIDVQSLPEQIDYTKVSKPSTRPSLFTYNTLAINENCELNFDGKSFIFYKAFDNPEKINYSLYLIKDKDNYLEFNSEAIKSSVNYQNLLNTNYSLDYICFEFNGSLADLEKGKYYFVIKIENDDLLDYSVLSSIEDIVLDDISYNDKVYHLYRSEDREKIMLEVK